MYADPQADLMTISPADEIEYITKRLTEIERLAGTVNLTDDRRDELVDEERRLEARLRELADKVLDQDTGLAEQLIKEEGANADEFPELPSQPPADE